jgi:hypothetical protein
MLSTRTITPGLNNTSWKLDANITYRKIYLECKKNSVIYRNQFMPNKLFQNNNPNNLVQFFVYLRVYAREQKPILKYTQTKTETTKQTHRDKQRQKTKQGNLGSNKIQYNISIQYVTIYMLSQQLQGQLQTQHNVVTGNYIKDKHNIKSKTNYMAALEEETH